jgi:uncharacterized protein (TIGR00290 family)
VETSGEEGRELGELETALADLKAREGIEGFVAGAVASEYQRTRLEGVGHRTGLKSFTPLWHKRGEAILATITRGGWDVRLGAVSAEGLGERHLGRRFHVAGEGGEYESAVLDAPFFGARVEVRRAETRWARDRGEWAILEAGLAPKPI